MRISIIIAFILFASLAEAQNLSVVNIDSSNFPTMKAKFYASDASGNLQSPSTAELSVTEDGVLRKITNITCPQITASPYTLGLMFDTHGGLNIAKAAAQKFLGILPVPPSEAGITVMDGGAYIMQDLTQKKSRLITRLASLSTSSTTDLQTMFYGPKGGGVEFVSGRPNKKALILLTDLHCPQYNLDKIRLFADCNKEEISVYIVLINANDYYGYFREIADKTGGELFEHVNTAEQANSVFLKISNELGVIPPCEVTWESEGSCSAGIRKVSFSWNSETAEASYIIPHFKLAQLLTSPVSLFLLAKPIGIRFDTTITITALSSAFTITNISSSNSLYDISPKSFSLAQGETKTLTISYTPKDSSYIWTNFSVSTDRCTQSFYVSSSYPGALPGANVPSIKIISPNGAEIYQSGSDTIISWSGIPPTDTVMLTYSLDNGQSWNVITSQATGGSYIWHLPNQTSTLCLVKVTQFARSAGNFVIRCGGTGSSLDAASVVTDKSGNLYVTGAADGTTDFGGLTLTSNVGQQVFVAKYNSSGSLLWVRYLFTMIGGGHSKGNSISLDPTGNIFVVGNVGGGTAIFNNDTLKSSFGYIFTIKLFPDGTSDWIQAQVASASGSIADALGVANDESGNVYVCGFFGDSLRFGNILLTGYRYWDIFVTKFLPDGTVAWAHKAGDFNFDKGYSVAVDKGGFVYMTGSFENDVDFDGTKVANHGQDDIFIAKYNPDGSLAWVKGIGGTTNDEGRGITIDPSGFIVVTGQFSGTVDFGGKILTSKGNNDMFVAKYLPDGTLTWVTQAGGINSTLGNGINSDPSGNIYVAGTFNGNADFGTQTLTRVGSQDVFIAAYSSDGTFKWAKRAGSSNNNYHGDAVTSDDFGNVYCSGSAIKDGDFDGVPSPHIGAGYQNLFVWKLGSQTPLQSDQSDNVFSIIAPTFSFSANTIDMGQVEAGKEKDSLVKATICNTSTIPLHVLGLDVTGGDKTEFMIMSGAGDFTLVPGECRDVMFTFMPMMTGKMSATVTLRTASGDFKDTVKILGEGIAPQLQVISNVIDFGQVKIGDFKDTIITVAIQNIGSLPVNFSSTSQLGPDVKQFSLQFGDAPFTLQPNATQSVTLRFAPKYIGRTSGRIGFANNSPNSPAILSVFGQGLGGLVSIKDDSGYAGDHKNIPMILEKVPITSVQSEATNFSARITYDRTVLYPSSGSIQHGARFDTVSINGALPATPDASGTLALLPFTVMLGESTISPMNIVDFVWLDGSGQPADYDVETSSGTFHMLGICPAGGNRLYNPDGQVTMAHVTPNPSKGIIHIDIQTTEVGRTQLSIMNLLGEKVAAISDGELKPGAHSFEFNSAKLSAGSYFLLLQTPTVRRLERVDVEK